MAEIRYDDRGNPIIVPSFIDTAMSFDGDWDSDFANITGAHTPKPAEASSMNDWLITPPEHSKQEETQPQPVLLARNNTRNEISIQYWYALPHQRLRRAMRYLGLPVALNRGISVPCRLVSVAPGGMSGSSWHTAHDESTRVDEPVSFAPEKLAQAFVVLLIWICMGYTIARLTGLAP